MELKTFLLEIVSAFVGALLAYAFYQRHVAHRMGAA